MSKISTTLQIIKVMSVLLSSSHANRRQEPGALEKEPPGRVVHLLEIDGPEPDNPKSSDDSKMTVEQTKAAVQHWLLTKHRIPCTTRCQEERNT